MDKLEVKEGIQVLSYGVEIPAPPGDRWVAVLHSKLPTRQEYRALATASHVLEVVAANKGNLELIKGLLVGAGSTVAPKVVQDILDALEVALEANRLDPRAHGGIGYDGGPGPGE